MSRLPETGKQKIINLLSMEDDTSEEMNKLYLLYFNPFVTPNIFFRELYSRILRSMRKTTINLMEEDTDADTRQKYFDLIDMNKEIIQAINIDEAPAFVYDIKQIVEQVEQFEQINVQNFRRDFIQRLFNIGSTTRQLVDPELITYINVLNDLIEAGDETGRYKIVCDACCDLKTSFGRQWLAGKGYGIYDERIERENLFSGDDIEDEIIQRERLIILEAGEIKNKFDLVKLYEEDVKTYEQKEEEASEEANEEKDSDSEL